jgi:hypothetical protein
MSSPNIRAQELKLQQDKFDYEKANPGSTVHTVVADDGTTSLLAVGKDGKATKVTLGGVEVKGVDTAAKRLKWEQDNPTLEIKEVTDVNGTTKFVAINKQAGTATQVTMGGADLSGVNTPAQRLAWEKANPGKEIKEVNQADGTIKLMAVDKQTGVATEVTSEGQPLVGAKFVQPTEMAKLIAERKALFDKNPKDPNIAVYDQKIKDEGLARERLDFDKKVQQWKVNHPGYSIQQDENGYLVGVNPNTLQGTYVTFGQPSAGGGKAGKPGVFPAANVQGKPSVLPPAAAVQAAPGAAPAVPTDGMPVSDNRMKGKSTGLTEGQSNAAMFGSAMAQAQQVFNQAEKEGTTTGAGTVNLAQGIVKYVPLGIGDKLVNDIYALAVNDPTKLFGPDINQQKIGQAQLAFSIAYLRKTSGANFGPSEVANTIMEYFPSVGEDKSVVKQKAESRKRAIAGMKISAGNEGKKFIEGYESPSGGASGAVASDPLGLFPAKK